MHGSRKPCGEHFGRKSQEEVYAAHSHVVLVDGTVERSVSTASHPPGGGGAGGNFDNVGRR